VSLKRFVPEMDELPRGYGVAYRSVTKHGAICYPIPLNLVVRWLYGVWLWLRFPVGTTWYEEIEIRAYERGREAGRDIGALQAATADGERVRRLVSEAYENGKRDALVLMREVIQGIKE